MAAGKPFGLKPGHTSTIRRIEGGMLSYHADMDIKTNPYELGLDRLVDLDADIEFIGKPALQKIHSDYVSSSSSSVAAAASSASTKSKSEIIGASTTKKKDSIDPFANYIRLHGDVDILCLQEHKIPLTQLSSRSEPHRCSSIEG